MKINTDDLTMHGIVNHKNAHNEFFKDIELVKVLQVTITKKVSSTPYKEMSISLEAITVTLQEAKHRIGRNVKTSGE